MAVVKNYIIIIVKLSRVRNSESEEPPALFNTLNPTLLNTKQTNT